MSRLNGGKDYSSVKVNYSKNGPGFPLRVHSLSVLTWGFQVSRYVMGRASAVRLKIWRRCLSTKQGSADHVGPSLFGAVLRPAAT